MRPALLIMALSLSLCAQEAPASPSPRTSASHSHAAQALHLTDTQKTQIKALRAKHKDALQAKHSALREARQTLVSAMKDPKSSQADLRRLHTQVSDMHFDLMWERRSLRQEVLALLTPEQREKAAELREQMRERVREHTRRALSGVEPVG